MKTRSQRSHRFRLCGTPPPTSERTARCSVTSLPSTPRWAAVSRHQASGYVLYGLQYHSSVRIIVCGLSSSFSRNSDTTCHPFCSLVFCSPALRKTPVQRRLVIHTEKYTRRNGKKICRAQRRVVAQHPPPMNAEGFTHLPRTPSCHFSCCGGDSHAVWKSCCWNLANVSKLVDLYPGYFLPAV